MFSNPGKSWLYVVFFSFLLMVLLFATAGQKRVQDRQFAPVDWLWSVTNSTPQFLAPKPTMGVVSAEQVRRAWEDFRGEHDLPSGESHPGLEKFARLLSLEIEDRQTLSIPDSQEIFLTLHPQPPSAVEVMNLFLPNGTQFASADFFADADNLLDTNLKHYALATRSARLEHVDGTIVVLVASGPFPTQPVPSQRTGRAAPNFTGEELWEAVQNYRRAHNLPLLAQANELCTVASIRLNEQIARGELDNHDGFARRSKEFFASHPDWTAINENLASGYQTAVQTVEWGWDQSLGHKALIQSREFPHACTAANQGFAVLITGR